MTTTPMTPERLREIAALCEAASGSAPGWMMARGAAADAIPELLAEIARLDALCTDSAQSYCRALDRQRAELEAAQAEVARLQSVGRALEIDCCELTDQRDVYRGLSQQLAIEVGETKPVIEQQDREALRLTETARAASENWMAACKQRDAARADVARLRTERDAAPSGAHEAGQQAGQEIGRLTAEVARLRVDQRECDRVNLESMSRIVALETALREACGYVDPTYCDDGTTTSTKDRLLAVAGAVESRTR